MKTCRFAAVAFLAAMVAMPLAASADPSSPPASGAMPALEGKSFDQYPSYIEVSGTAKGLANSQFDLRCGYSFSNGKVALDPTLNDFSLVNSTSQAYSRYQNIDGKAVITGPDPAVEGGKRVIVQVAEPDGTMKARNCALDTSTDTISACMPAKATMTVAQAKSKGEAVEKQCQAFVQHAQVEPTTFSAVKTAEFKKKLEGKLMALETNQ